MRQSHKNAGSISSIGFASASPSVRHSHQHLQRVRHLQCTRTHTITSHSFINVTPRHIKNETPYAPFCGYSGRRAPRRSQPRTSPYPWPGRRAPAASPAPRRLPTEPLLSASAPARIAATGSGPTRSTRPASPRKTPRIVQPYCSSGPDADGRCWGCSERLAEGC